MEIIGLLLYGAFYVSLIIKARLMKRKGIQANLLMKSEGKDRNILVAEFFVNIGTFGMGTVQFISIFFNNSLSKFSFPIEVRIAGVIFQLLGILFLNLAMYTMRDSWRQGVSLKQNTEFVSGGIYKYSRNPAFVGFDLFYLGGALFLQTYIGCGYMIYAITAFHIQILAEEKSLVIMFGEKYKEYYKRTPRYLLF